MFVATRYATHENVEFKCSRLHSEQEWSLFFCGVVQMIVNEGHFYYIDDQYYVDFPDDKLMLNKEMVNGQAHDRPCFYAFRDDKTGLLLDDSVLVACRKIP